MTTRTVEEWTVRTTRRAPSKLADFDPPFDSPVVLWIGLDPNQVQPFATRRYVVSELLLPLDDEGAPTIPTVERLTKLLEAERQYAAEHVADPERIALVARRDLLPPNWIPALENGEGGRPSVRLVCLVGPAREGDEANPLSSYRFPIVEVEDVEALLDPDSQLRRMLRPMPWGPFVRDFEHEESFERESFEFLDPESWRITGSGRDRRLSLFQKKSSYQPPHRSPLHFALLDLERTTFVLDLDVRSTHPPYPHRDVCIAFGWQDPSHFYYAHLGQNADDSSHTILVVDGADRAPIVESRTEGIAWDEEWHRVRLERNVEDGAIRVYFDDFEHPVLEAHDTRFGRGKIGFGSFDDTADFDSIRLYSERLR